MSQFYHIGGVFPGRHWSSLVIIGRHRLSLAVIGFQTYPGAAALHTSYDVEDYILSISISVLLCYHAVLQLTRHETSETS